MVVGRVTYFQDEGLDVLVLHMYEFVVIKVAVMEIESYYYIVDRGGAVYIG